MPYVHSLLYLVVSLVVALVSAAVRPKEAPLALQGTIICPERAAVAPGSTVEVELVDGSSGLDEPPVVARREIAQVDRVPMPFDIAVDRERLVPGGAYFLRARIRSGERVLFESDDPVRALLDDAHDLELVVRSRA